MTVSPAQLAAACRNLGLPTTHRNLATSTILTIPNGGRLLGLWPEAADDNFLWTHPGLLRPTPTITDPNNSWLNPGGDRTWLAPEVELFFDPAGQSYAVPSAVDPGTWQVSSGADGQIGSSLQSRVPLRRSGCGQALVRISKTWQAIGHPMPDLPGLAFAGYQQTTRLEILEAPDPSVQLGLWSLAQLPAPGWMLIATTAAIQPEFFFGTTHDSNLISRPRLLVWHMPTQGGDAKIGVQASDFTGLAGHLHRRAADCWDLIIRQVAVDPAGAYVDGTWTPPHRRGWAFQACQVRSLAGGFNELEHHVPAAALGRPSMDTCQLWALRGSAAAIRRAAECRFGPLPDRFFADQT